MCQTKRINFNDETRIDDEEMELGGDLLFDNEDAPDTVSNSVQRVDGGTLVQNLQKPYLFLTVKQFADNVNELDGSSLLDGSASFAPMIDRGWDGSSSRARSMLTSSFNIDSEFGKPRNEDEFVILNEKGMDTSMKVIS